ncbi:tape measure protein [Lentilactobacillus sp. Marseille-Q4993]|uniref:tape measure protein n=1 Tax=Lentilactobacillus sp. Marseille-Q4993 TaxID=3039492 RepID=UPI0024BC18FC|nr:tape measure protein [Lentilactobacillus sp. Marseille-Q4993]
MSSTISATIRINDGFSSSLDKLASGLGKSQSMMSRFKSAMSGGMDPKVPNRLTSGFNNMNTSVSKGNGLFSKFLGANVIGAGITKGIGLITNSMGDAIARVDTLNNATRSFQNMGFSAKQTSSSMKYLDKAITGLPTPMDAAVRNTQLLAASTGKIGKSTKIFEAMNNGILGFGGSAAQVDTAVTQLSQAFSNGKVDMATWNSMINGGMGPALNAIAKEMDMTTGKLKTGLSTGKVSVEDFQDALIKLNEKGGGGMKSLRKIAQDSTSGIGTAMANFKTAVVRGMAGGLDALADAGMTDFINNMTNGIKGAIPSIQNAMKGIVSFIAPIGSQMMKVFGNVGKGLSQFFDSIADTGAISAVGDAMNAIADAVGHVVKSLSSAGGSKFGMFNELGKLAGGALKGAANGIKAIADVIGNMDPGSLKLLAAGFIALKAGTKGLVLTGVVAALNMLSKLDAGTLNSLAKVLGVLAIGFATIKAVGAIDNILTGIGKGMGALGNSGALANAGTSAATAAKGFIQLGVSLLLIGAAVLMAGAGLWLIANAAMALVTAGWPAIAMFFAMIAVLIILAIVVAVAGTAMIMGAVGFLVFGAAVLLVGIGVFLAATGMALLATQLPIVATYGLMAAMNMVVLGAALMIFSVFALIAAVGILMLAMSLIILAVGLAVAAVGALLLGVALMLLFAGAIMAFAGLLMVFVGAIMAFAGLVMVMAGAMLAMMGLMLVMMASMMAMIGLMMVMLGGMMAMIGLMMVMIGGMMAMIGLMMVMVGAMMAMIGLVMVAAVAVVAAVGLTVLGVGAIAASAGMVVLGAATALVASQVSRIASQAAAAASSLQQMVTAVNVVKAALNTMKSIAQSAVQGFIAALRGGVGNAAAAGRALAQAATNGMRSGVGPARAAGAAIGAGLAAGLRSQVGAVAAAADALVAQANRAARAAAKVHSPSRLFAEIGSYMGQGLALGMQGTTSMIANAGSRMAHSAINAVSLSGLNPGAMLAQGMNQAIQAAVMFANTINGVGGKTVALNRQMNANSSALSSSPFNNGVTPYGTTTTSDNSETHNGGNTITIEAGAIQLNGTSNNAEDAESILFRIEQYLQKLDQTR